MTRILALDCGGTRSSAILVDGDGRLLRHTELGAANLYATGAQAVAQVVAQALERAPGAEAVAIAAAGVRTDEDRGRILAAVRSAGIALPLSVWSDARAALRAGGEGQGIVVIAGTGSSAWALDADGRERRRGGWGSVLGDEGSGYWMGLELLRTAVRLHDAGSRTRDPLREAVLGKLDLEDVDALRAVAHAEDARVRIAGLVPTLASLWRAGDRHAERIVRRGAWELARLALLASDGLRFEGQPHALLAGGVFRALPELEEQVARRVGQRMHVSLLDVDPAWGAYWLAREGASWDRAESQPEPAPTELANPASDRIHMLSTVEMLRVMNAEDQRVAPAVGRCLEDIARLVDEAASRMPAGRGGKGGRLIYAGAGTSGRLAILDAVECVPTFGSSPEEVVALLAGGEAAMTRAVEGAEDDAEAGEAAIARMEVSDRDVVVGVSASGGAPYVRAALAEARRRGALTALITCNPGAAVLSEVVIGIGVDVGPEVIAGSTRLKAGTAQKLVLNMVSTAVMIRLGRTLGNRMVGVRPTNDKLRSRAIGLVRELSGASEDEAREKLESLGWDVGLAVLTVKIGDANVARSTLRSHQGNLQAALKELAGESTRED